MAADWASDVIAGVERWIALAGGPTRPATWSDLGAADPRDDGRLALDVRDRPVDVLDPCLAGEQGPERDRAYPVEELRDENGVLVMRSPPGLPEGSRHLWVRPVSALGRLLEGLRAAGKAPLAQALAEKRLAAAPTSQAAGEGLAGAQVEAFRACLGPGVRLVCAAPDADKTPVLARAIETLVGAGKRVLLVSPVDLAVDEALDAVVRRMAPEPGVAVRVGPSRMPDDVRVERLAAQASREIDEERAAVAAELLEIEELGAEVERLRAELGDYDEPAYRAAAARLVAERALDELRPRLQEAETAADVARRAAVTAATELRQALDAQAALGPVHDAFEHERRAVEGLAALARRHRALRDDRAALDEQQPSVGWGARRRHRRRIDAADAELHRFAAAAAQGRRRWLDVRLKARAVIGEHTRSDLDAVDMRAASAEYAVARADEEYRRARGRLIGLRSAVDAAEARGEPTEDDRRLVADTEARGLPGRQARLRELVGRQDGAAPLDARYRALVERARAQRVAAEARVVGEARVVATTLARSRIHPALADAAFDVVLVDEAGGAALAEVLLALCRATTTAVLIGDVRQVGPAVPDDQSPAVQRWVRATCFSHLGIESPADVIGRDGCVALTECSVCEDIPEQRDRAVEMPAVR
jgi:AAA domain-containing protein